MPCIYKNISKSIFDTFNFFIQYCKQPMGQKFQKYVSMQYFFNLCIIFSILCTSERSTVQINVVLQGGVLKRIAHGQYCRQLRHLYTIQQINYEINFVNLKVRHLRVSVTIPKIRKLLLSKLFFYFSATSHFSIFYPLPTYMTIFSSIFS